MKRGARRVSEQEVRFLFAHAVEHVEASDLLYSVETPTIEKYCFSGGGYRSASTDLSLFAAQETQVPLLNVEFKAKGRSPDRLVDRVVRKDVAKLLAESAAGLWYHLLKNANSATLENLVKLLNEALADLGAGGLSRYTKAALKPKRLYFHICVLERGLALHCSTDVRADGEVSLLDVPRCSIKSGGLSIDEPGAWQIALG